jgi:RNA polymerase sigma factor (sigma-70 family)
MAENDDDFRDLMRRVGEGADDAAWELVNRYGEEIRRAVRRVLNANLRPKFDSLDFVQLVWKSFFRVRDKSDRFHRPEELAAYLVAMAKNKVGMEARRRFMTKKYNIGHERSFDQVHAEDMACRQPAPIDVAIAHERWDQLLKDQPVHYQQIIHLRLQGHTCLDIGKAVHLDERTVRRFLKKLLYTTSE